MKNVTGQIGRWGEAKTISARDTERSVLKYVSTVSQRDDVFADHPSETSYDAANFMTLMASKFCTPPPTRLVV